MTTDQQQRPTHPPGPYDDGYRPAPTVGEASRRVTPVVLGLVLVVAGLAGVGFLWSDAFAQVDETTTTHPPVEQVVLDLGADGDVEVRVHDADEIVVQERVERTIGEVDVTQQVTDGTLELRSRRCGSWFSVPFIRCSASYVVTVPAATSVAGELAHGRITLTGLDGSADVRTGHGTISATDVTGPLTLGSGHGQVDVAGVDADVRVETSHGSILLTDVAGAAEAVTGHGRVEATGVGGDLLVDTSHGSVHLHDVAGPVEVWTGHGSVELSQVAGDLVVETSHGAIDASGTGGAAIRLISGHGDVEFAPTVPPRTAALDTSHGDVTVALPSGAPPYAIATDTSDRAADIQVPTDPAADHRLDLRTGHGDIVVRHAGG